MRFSILTVTALVSAVLAHYDEEATSTSYVTEVHTKTQCAASVTNCPAHSTIVSTTSYPVISPTPSVYHNASTPVVPASSYIPPPPPVSSPGGAVTSPVSLSTLTISTCVPTVIYSTITVTPSPPAVPTSAPAGPVGGSTGTISIHYNVTAPTTPATPSGIEASGATNVQGSIIVAAFAGLAAFLFA